MNDNIQLEKIKVERYLGICRVCGWRTNACVFPIEALQSVKNHQKLEGCNEAAAQFLAHS